MANDVYYKEVSFSNSYELHRYFLGVYQTLIKTDNGKDYLRPRLIEVMSYYLLFGYSDDTKKMILEQVPDVNYNNLKQINSELQQKGLLDKDKFINNKRYISDSLINMQDYVNKFKTDEDGSPIFLIKFKKV